MRTRIAETVIILLIAMLLAGFASSPAFAGKACSDQACSSDKGIVVIGNDNKYATVYGISIPDKKVIWQTYMPQSRDVEIIIEGDVVYLVGKGDLRGLAVIAHELTGKNKLWSIDLNKTTKEVDEYSRISAVFTDEKRLYFATDVNFREKRRAEVFAINKSNGKIEWKYDGGFGSIKNIAQSPSGDFVAVIQYGDKTKIARIKKDDGKLTWEQQLSGAPVTKPVSSSGAVYLISKEPLKDKGKLPQEELTIINEENGSVIFTEKLEKEDKPLGDLIIFGDKALFATKSGKIACLNGKAASPDKVIEWTYDAGEAITSINVTPENKILVLGAKEIDKGTTSTIASLSEKGTKEWSSEVNGVVENPLTLIEGRILCEYRPNPIDEKDTRIRTFLTALDSASGEEVWASRNDGKFEGWITANGNSVYFSIYNEPQQSEADKKAGKETKPHILIALDVLSGRAKWIYNTTSVVNTALSFAEGTVQFGTKDGDLISINDENGSEQFKFFAGNENELDSSIVQSSGLLAFATQNGNYYIIDSAGKAQKKMSLKPGFAMNKMPIFIGIVLLGGAVAWYIYHARRGKDMFIRRIAGLTAIEEAVGRSTEMGKSVLYITGLADVDEIQTLASLSILGHIAQKTAEYDTPLVVPCCRSVVMSTAQEVVKESYMKAGRPDTFRRENIHYLTDDQFGYVAGVDGIMVREKPAANFYMGKFYAESLILAETGHSTGAIQIAGTAEASQLPFFVAACDYTLIGEELYAASAYLSNDPMQIGSLKGQDIAKMIILIAFLLGCISLTFDIEWIKQLFITQ